MAGNSRFYGYFAGQPATVTPYDRGRVLQVYLSPAPISLIFLGFAKLVRKLCFWFNSARPDGFGRAGLRFPPQPHHLPSGLAKFLKFVIISVVP